MYMWLQLLACASAAAVMCNGKSNACAPPVANCTALHRQCRALHVGKQGNVALLCYKLGQEPLLTLTGVFDHLCGNLLSTCQAAVYNMTGHSVDLVAAVQR